MFYYIIYIYLHEIINKIYMRTIIGVDIDDIKGRNTIISAINYININKYKSDYKEWLLHYSFDNYNISDIFSIGFKDKYKIVTGNLFNIPVEYFDNHIYNNKCTYMIYNTNKFIDYNIIKDDYTIFKSDYDIGYYINRYGNKIAFNLNTILNYVSYKLELNLLSKQFIIDYVINTLNENNNKYIIVDLEDKLYFNSIINSKFKTYIITNKDIDYDKIFKINIDTNKYSIYSTINNILELLKLK